MHLAKEAKATMPLRKTGVVDLVIFEPYFISVMQRKDPVSRIGKGGKIYGKQSKFTAYLKERNKNWNESAKVFIKDYRLRQ